MLLYIASIHVCTCLPSLDCSLTELLLEPVIANVVGLMELVLLLVLASSGIGVGGAGFACA